MSRPACSAPPRRSMAAGSIASRPAALCLAMILGAMATAAASEPTTLAVPVRFLSAAAGPDVPAAPGSLAMAAPAAQDAPPFAAGLPPQYRAAPSAPSQQAVDPDDPRVRFLVPLGQRPLLVEARITIDGHPFRMLREQRIDRLLMQLAQSTAASAAPTPDGAAETGGADGPLAGRLARYVQATQRPATREEVRWLLRQWMAGTNLVLVSERFEALRAERSPLFQALDRDADGTIGREEWTSAERTLLRHDRNQDEVLSPAELTEAAGRPSGGPAGRPPEPAPLIPVDDLASAAVWGRLVQRYAAGSSQRSTVLGEWDADGDGRIDRAERARLHRCEPDLRVEVAFDTDDPASSRMTIQSPRDASGPATRRAETGTVTLEIAGTLLELSAVQSAMFGAGVDQVAIGAVRDGYPLLPIVDHDQDGRLGLRELRQVSEQVGRFDRDADDRITAAEVLPTMRVAIGLGPIAHLPLADVRTIYPPTDAPPANPPEWFVRMDRNRDGDLAPREFLGGEDAFANLDGDGDGLISASEAQSHPPSQ